MKWLSFLCSVFLMASLWMMSGCHSSDSSTSSQQSSLLSLDEVSGECQFDSFTRAQADAKFGKSYVEAQESLDQACKESGQSCPYIFTLADLSFKEAYPYPDWNDYAHAGNDDGTGKGELDEYTVAVNAVKEKRLQAVEAQTTCARLHCELLGGQWMGVFDIGAFGCDFPSFEDAMTIAGRPEVASFNASSVTEDP